MGGLSIGVFWGCVVSALGLAALSLSFPLPPEQTDDVTITVPITQVEDPVAETPSAPTVIVEEAPDADDAVVADLDAEDDAETSADAETPAVGEPAPAPEATPAASPEADPALAETGAEAEAEESESETPARNDEAAPATEVPLPSGSEFNRPPPEPEAALPEPDAAPISAAPQAPVLAGNEIAPRFDTMPASQPSVAAQAPSAIRSAPADARAPASPATSPAPVIASGPNALTQPGLSDGPQVRTARLPQVVTAPEPEPEQVPAPEPEMPETEAVAAAEASAEVAEEPETADAGPNVPLVDIETPSFPTVVDVEAVGGALPSVGAAAASGSRLPQIAPIATPEAADDAAEASTEGEAPVSETVISAEVLPAIQRFAADFDPTEARPLMAVVLIDDPENPMDLDTLSGFSFPVAFAVDPLAPDAEARAAAFRAAGFEVVILGTVIVDGATASDIEVALAGAQEILPEAIAVMDTPEGRIQGDRPVLDATVAALSRSGHGLLAFPRGLNAAEQTAAREGVPGATVFRSLDDEDQRATVITRFLSRAAFAAAQEGTVIVVGRTRPDTVTALFSWALSGRTEAVALAPLSATMLRSAE
ncbi:divergent polysaccharide deacetylase family protein [Gymnodinialimonas ceratoperidinii]|uniref:Divergent polysaccharide deacetylase family protein n=1 Tax=Gymnodinialimonas ceratoperidinii TaxID=2856823 RepID=A0A8F6TVK1_9RHOB|nr:polysaccharide deacteylase family 2 protein [Gymnodinialimonas ceratoperidinii]QXT38699.1 divergent polysaccharide deacetylase family protein [Gymnodinialimonas ceratoperidinii]